MQGIEVYGILKAIGATRLHHANSVTTSCTFLEQGGLLSRGFVEAHGLAQTPQPSDNIDKKYNIWNRIFVDQVDIHERASRRNYYGPALFVLELDILRTLSAGTDILVTKKNPVHWIDNEPETDRWFRSVEELTGNIRFGNFDKMLVIETPSGKLDFPDAHARIILDDPQRQVSSGENAFTHAENRIKAAATTGKVEVRVDRRACSDRCGCIRNYLACGNRAISSCFA
jgi:hypothetical protein